MKIAIDAMGSDKAPAVEVEGAVQAVEEYGYDLLLVGDESRIHEELKKYKNNSGKLAVKHASEVIEMNEPAAISVRRKRNSSVVIGLDALKKGEADAFVSAGNTGAVVCAATLSLRLLPAIERPGIALVIPSLSGASLIIDVGANINPKPIHLLQYGIMADAYSRYILHKKNPSVGLLNVGEEESKGTEFIKEAHTLLSESKLNFIGNIEGRDIYSGKADIVLCDGFVGNVILKVSESVVDTIMQLLKAEIKSSIIATLGAALSSSAFTELKKKMDYSEYGGAPLLGVDGRCIICHGSSNPKAIKNAIRVAAEFIKEDVNKHIVEELESY
ncbi:MAG: phosphate acyltransferase [Omnitrophica bacterium RIFCSPLOWO2_01_FULL_45_10]|nr:MAG: phosphate acyltransferase [Omnitrophica bacterium RIFCSPLOWO2_01_FULL_45_10]